MTTSEFLVSGREYISANLMARVKEKCIWLLRLENDVAW
jgi:hypothetical protein